jgi:hypothetical protein
MAKAVVCVQTCVEDAHQAAIRECDGFRLLASVVDIFAGELTRSGGDSDSDSSGSGSNTSSRVLLDHYSKSIVESVLEILACAIDSSRRNGFSGSEGDNEVQILQRDSFTRLATAVFRAGFKGHEYLWAELFSLIREGVNAEPTYLGQFLRSDYAVPIQAALSDPHAFFMASPSHLDVVLPHIARFTSALCITAEGREWVLAAGLPQLIVEAFVHPAGCMPMSEGISTDTCRRCARVLMHMMKDNEELAMDAQSALQNALLGVCAEAQSIAQARNAAASLSSQANSGGCDDDTLDMASPRMQALQKLAGVCALAEATNTDSGRTSSDGLRQVFNEDVIEALVGAYACILPSEVQMAAQLSTRQAAHLQASLQDTRNNSSSHRGSLGGSGFLPAAKAHSSLMKVAAGLVPQLMLPVVLKLADEQLSEVSGAKAAMRALAVAHEASTHSNGNNNSANSNNAKDGSPHSASSTEGTSSSAEAEDDNSNSEKEAVELARELQKMELERPPERSARQRRRSRGGSLGGDGANVLIVGVLDYVPHRCHFDPQTRVECSSEMRVCLWKLLGAVLTLEWHGLMLSYCLRSSSRGQNPGAATISDKNGKSKDVLRRLFAFHRSSLLEVCRGASKSWAGRALDEASGSSLSLMEIFNDLDDAENVPAVPLERVPSAFMLRVVSQNGALIREDCEMEGSRVVFLAPVGSVVKAYQRSQTAAGVVRYRTEHGWLSEYRRDHQRDNIVEVLSCTYSDQSEELNGKGISLDTIPGSPSDFDHAPAGTQAACAVRKLAQALSMREVLSYCMTRVRILLYYSSSFFACL